MGTLRTAHDARQKVNRASMPTKTSRGKRPRQPLSRDRVLQAALRLADRRGVDALSMRTLAQSLGVEAMSLYKHVANKDDVLDSLVDLVLGQIQVPPPGTEWRSAMRDRARSARQVFRRHPWAVPLFESRLNRTPSPIRLAYPNAVIGLLRQGGFSVPMAYRAFLLLDSYLYGFLVQEVNWGFDDRDRLRTAREAKDAMTRTSMEAYPHLVELTTYVMGPRGESPSLALDTEFDHGLELILDGLERLRQT